MSYSKYQSLLSDYRERKGRDDLLHLRYKDEKENKIKFDCSKGFNIRRFSGEEQIELCGHFYRASNIYGLHRRDQSPFDWCHVQGHAKTDEN